MSEQQIEGMAPNPAAFVAGKKLSGKAHWQRLSQSERAAWGEIKGSGSSPYLVAVDRQVLAYKCSCPSRQFPCKHSIALLLLLSHEAQAFSHGEEPEWVKSWVDKREVKEKKKSEEPEESGSDDDAKLEKARDKTQADRLSGVLSGANDLELWLKDLVRIGLLELSNKPKADIEKMAARMVDAKAAGLAGWVMALAKINYENPDEWQGEALSIIARLFLLVRALRNYNNLSPLWQETVRSLAGWSQSPKELVADKDALSVKDQWLVAGEELESADDLIIQRLWLAGAASHKTALILNFGTKFSPLERTVVAGSAFEGELVFFSSVLPQRAVVRMKRSDLKTPPFHALDDWEQVRAYAATNMKLNPWINDEVVMLSRARLAKHGGAWFVCDRQGRAAPLVSNFDQDKIFKWLAISGNRSLTMALVLRGDRVLPLGVFHENSYTLVS